MSGTQGKNLKRKPWENSACPQSLARAYLALLPSPGPLATAIVLSTVGLVLLSISNWGVANRYATDQLDLGLSSIKASPFRRL